MATNQILPAVTAAEALRKGFLKISLDPWATTAKPFITIGSTLEVGGALFQVDTANADPDSTAAWGGLAPGLCYCRTVPGVGLITFEMTATAPTVWDTNKQAWMDATLTKRYIFQVVKDAGANWAQKTILLDREHGIMAGGVSVGIGADANRVIRFAEASTLDFDNTNRRYSFTGNLIHVYLKGAWNQQTNCTQNNIFDSLTATIVNVGDTCIMSGGGRTPAAATHIFVAASRTGANTIDIHYLDFASGLFGTTTCTDGSATIVYSQMAGSWMF